MSAYDIILKRRSIRKFTDKKIDDAAIDKLMKAAMAGPSACNKQPWEFYVIKDKETQAKVKKATPLARMESSLIIVVAADQDRALSKWDNDFWIQDCSASVENILLTATEMEIGTCWCGVFPQEICVRNVKKALDLPENIIPMSLIHLGYTEEEFVPRTQYNPERVHVI